MGNDENKTTSEDLLTDEDASPSTVTDEDSIFTDEDEPTFEDGEQLEKEILDNLSAD